MEMLAASYDDGSNTPKTDRNEEETTVSMTAEYDLLMSSLQFDATSENAVSTKDGSKVLKTQSSVSKSKASDVSSSDSDSSSDDDSGSEDDIKMKKDSKAKQRSSDSTDYSSDSSSSSGDSKQDKELAKHPEQRSEVKERRAATDDSRKADSKSRRSRSGSRGHRRRQSLERHHHSDSHSRDRHHRSIRSERRSGHRSRSRSHSKDRHSRRHSSRERRHRDGHRRRRSNSHDAHRHHRRPSPIHRRRHHSRSPEQKKSHSEKHRRSRSPHATSNAKGEEYSRPMVFKTAGLKFSSRGRGNANGFKEQLKREFIQNVTNLQVAVSANPNQPPTAPPLIRSNVCTPSAGLGVTAGCITTAILNQMQMLHRRQGILPGTLTQEQMAINQRALLQATGRTREQVEHETGVKVPDYYNENTNNFKELAERTKKRNMLFKNKAADTRANNPFSAKPILPGADQAQAEKFSRLLGGRKHTTQSTSNSSPEHVEDEVIKEAERQSYINADLMKEYDSARVATHMNRGAGLGYSTTLYQPLN